MAGIIHDCDDVLAAVRQRCLRVTPNFFQFSQHQVEFILQ